MASLTVVVDGVEQKIPLETASVTLGRGLESDVRLKDIKASRRHCQVVKAAKGYQCVDLSSGNGTYVNGVQIKTQPLAHGDKITIGSTTIVFEDAPKPSISKAATAKIPVAAGPTSATSTAKPASGKVATAKVPVAPTRRTTERVEAVKAKSGGIPAVKPAARPGKPGGRTSSLRPARTASADAAPERKKSPILIVVAVVVVLALGGAGWFLLAGRDNGDQVKEQIEQLVKKAEASESKDQYDAAIADYRKALDLCKGDRYKINASKISKQIALLENRKAASPPPKQDPKEAAPEKVDAFPAKKAEIADKYKIGSADSDWGGALKEWTEFAGKKPPADGVSKAQAEIKTLQAKAREESASLRKKADALAKENKMAEAVSMLKAQAGRFEGTDAQADLEASIKQYDK